ncbi:MAG: CZB domain-containing protein [Candidatus Omnitrophica bacterium]|nr:CZB domain-containing protein [Candidatus Omnitrophota bacterium]
MINVSNIDGAIYAHGQWLRCLKRVIETGESDFSPTIVRTDNNCDFGKWLYGDFSTQFRGQPIYAEIRDIHLQFHVEAGKILELALQGKKSEALRLMEPGSVFMKISNSLVLKMTELKNEIH